jgi:serine/threonine-protein kinase
MKRGESYGAIIDDLMELVADGLQDRYSIDGLLGTGGMAVVFAARDLARRHPVAIKVLNPDIASEVAAARFVREVLWSSSLEHPHIVPVLGSGEVAGYPYLVMPLIEGSTLADRLATHVRLPIAMAIKYATEVASALDYAHRKGVVHRDIKPDNILISDDFAMVADFGIARALGLASGNTLTGAGGAIGTLAYMSPEQEEGWPDIDGRSDIYSLGCVVYEMLAGRRAFDGTTFGDIIRQKRESHPPALETLRPDVPGEIIRAVARAVETRPDARFPTAGEFGAVLAAVTLPPVAAGAVSARSRSGVWLLAAAVVAVVVLVVLLLGNH